MHKEITFYRYEVKVPFVSKGVVDPDKWNLYKLVWPVHLTKNTLALVGFARINGLIPTVTELQARWVTRVLQVCNDIYLSFFIYHLVLFVCYAGEAG